MWTRTRSVEGFDRVVVDGGRGRLVVVAAVEGAMVVEAVVALWPATPLVSILLPRRLIGVVTVSSLESRAASVDRGWWREVEGPRF